jgi:FlaA1/EpsC-like NDP-sugar epimerase
MKIIVYGAGNNCKKILENVQDEIICIVDRDSSKVGTVIMGHPVVSVKDIVNYEYDLMNNPG